MYLDCQLFIIVIKAIQPDCDKVKGISVLLLETPLTRSKYIFPIHTRTMMYANFKNLLHIRDVPTGSPNHQQNNPSLVENLMSRGRRDNFWIVSSRLRPYSDFSKHSRKSRTVPSIYCKPNPGRSPHTRHQIYIYKKIDK